MAKGLWVTEKSGHAGEGGQTSEQTNVICDSEGRALRLGKSRLHARRPPGASPQPARPPPQAQPHFSCWVMSSSSLR